MSNSQESAAEQVVVPDIGDADGVEVIEFCVQPGDAVAVDDALLVIESDKASMEIQSTAAGVVAGFSVALGDVVNSGQVIAEISVSGVAVEPSQGGSSASTPTASDPAQEPARPAAAQASEAAEPAVIDAAPGTAQSSTLEVRLPDIGDAGEVVVIELGAAVGDSVEAEQMLLVVESDKASMDIVAPSAGVLTELKVSEGDSVGEDALLAVLRLTDAVSESIAPARQEVQQTSSEPQPVVSAQEPPVSTATSSEVRAAPAPQRDASGLAPPPERAAPPPKRSTIYAGPAVRRIARELGVDLTRVTGTGARGRIVKDDVHLYVKTSLASDGTSSASGAGIPVIPEIDFTKYGATRLEPMSRILKRGASNLHRSWLNVVHVTQHDEADITELEVFRKSLKPEGERRGVKITPLAFIAKACAHMLGLHPKFNASLDSKVENLIIKDYVNIGFAVDTPDGLLVPVVRDADKKGVWELAEEINELAAKARDKKLAPQDLQGGSFSISSLGSIGGTGFTPIVNAPEVAILGVAKLAMKPQWDGEAFVPRKMLPLSLSYDHRAINGAEAGRFVTELSALLADMRRVML